MKSRYFFIYESVKTYIQKESFECDVLHRRGLKMEKSVMPISNV